MSKATDHARFVSECRAVRAAITIAVASGPSDSLAPALELLEPVIPPLAYHLLLDVVRAAVAEIDDPAWLTARFAQAALIEAVGESLFSTDSTG